MKTFAAIVLVAFATPAAAADLERLGVHWAPKLYQDTADGVVNDWRNRRYDLITRVDFDGNQRADDNWENAEHHALPAFVYHEAIETETHVFLTYGFYHPRDWEELCFYPLCHEGDQENYRLTIAKDGSEFGRPILLDGDTHGFHRAYAIGDSVRAGRTDLDDDALSFDGSHVRLFVEARGHGPYPCSSEAACRKRLGHGDGVVYRPTRDGRGSEVSEVDVRARQIVEAEYGLLRSFEELWGRHDEHEVAFDSENAHDYLGGRGLRVGHRVAKMYNADRFGAQGGGHTSWGVEFVSGGADRLLDWGLDPALSVREHFEVDGEGDPARWSMTYTCHPYLGIFTSCPDRDPSRSKHAGANENVKDASAPVRALLAEVGVSVSGAQVFGALAGAMQKLSGAESPAGLPGPSVAILKGEDAGWRWKVDVGIAPKVVAQVYESVRR